MSLGVLQLAIWSGDGEHTLQISWNSGKQRVVACRWHCGGLSRCTEFCDSCQSNSCGKPRCRLGQISLPGEKHEISTRRSHYGVQGTLLDATWLWWCTVYARRSQHKLTLLRFDVKPKKVTAEDGRTKAFSPAVCMARTRLSPKQLHIGTSFHPMNLPTMDLGWLCQIDDYWEPSKKSLWWVRACAFHCCCNWFTIVWFGVNYNCLFACFTMHRCWGELFQFSVHGIAQDSKMLDRLLGGESWNDVLLCFLVFPCFSHSWCSLLPSQCLRCLACRQFQAEDMTRITFQPTA